MKMTKGGFDILRKNFGTLTSDFVNGVNLIVASCEKHSLTYPQASYVIATAYHETNATMLPVREAYWLSENWRKQNLRYYPYYGRGFVQLTWDDNYLKAGEKLGYGTKFVTSPDLVMSPEVSAEILVLGSKEGWFTRKTLSDYINNNKKDYVSARKIINGTDKASKVAKEALIFEQALRTY